MYEIIYEISSCSNTFGLNPDEKDKSVIYCTGHQKIYKNHTGASTKNSTKAVSEAFKLIFHQIQSFYNKSHFYSSFKQF